MIDLAGIQRLKTAIAAVLASYTLHESKTEDFKDEVIANAGGVVPMFLWEYHTRMDAYRHKTFATDAFIAEGIPYGNLEGAGWVNLIEQRQLSVIERNIVLGQRADQDASIEHLLPLVQFLDALRYDYGPTINLQPSGDGLFMGIQDMAYFLQDNEITRGIRFDEPYYVSVSETGTGDISFGTLVLKTLERSKTHLERNSETFKRDYYGKTNYSTFLHPFCKTLYSPPYCYVVYKDRTVKYHVDNE